MAWNCVTPKHGWKDHKQTRESFQHCLVNVMNIRASMHHPQLIWAPPANLLGRCRDYSEFVVENPCVFSDCQQFEDQTAEYPLNHGGWLIVSQGCISFSKENSTCQNLDKMLLLVSIVTLKLSSECWKCKVAGSPVAPIVQEFCQVVSESWPVFRAIFWNTVNWSIKVGKRML